MKIILISVVVVSICIAVSTISNDAVPSISSEKDAVEKLRSLVFPKIPRTSLVYKWAKDDLYLLKWLNASSMDVNKAKALVLEHLKWREAEKIDGIANEDWSQIQKDFAYLQGTYDKNGRPIAELWLNDWNIHQGIMDGKSSLIYRWIVHNYETLNRQLYDVRAKGANISGVTLLQDVENFSLSLQGSPYCLPLFSAVTNILETHYPSLMEAVYVVNTPSTYNVVIWTIQPFLKSLKNTGSYLYTDKEKWLPALNEVVDPSQRSSRFGGTYQN